MHFHTRIFNTKLVAHLLGTVLLGIAGFMLLPIVVSFSCNDGAQRGFLFTLGVVSVLGVLLRNVLGRKPNYDFYEKESFWLTSIVWIVVPMVCALPYLLTGTFSSVVDAMFESFSGFTSTGSTVVTDFDNIPKSILVWRSMSQWIGGLGLMLLTIAVVRKLKKGMNHLYSAEFSGTVQQKIHPRMSTTVRRMWYVYIFFTILLLVFLLLVGNDFIEALCLSLSTISTGGFSPRAYSITSFGQSTQIAVTVFMFISGINISLLYHLLRFRPIKLWQNEEFRRYLTIILVASILLLLMLYANGADFFQAAKFSLFQVVSAISTTGYYTVMPSGWIMIVPLFMFMLMFFGACSGSSGGGIKIVRVLILFKYVRNQFTVMLHPRAVVPVKIDGQIIQTSYINKIFAFVFMYFVFIVLGAFVFMCCGLTLSDSLSVALANISNIGPVIDTIGGSWSYATLPLVAKLTIIFEMLLGRLEIFAIIAIFSPSYWRG